MKLPFYIKVSALLLFLLYGFSFCKDGGKEDNGDNGSDPEIPVKGDVTLYVTTNNRTFDFKKIAVDFSKRDNM